MKWRAELAALGVAALLSGCATTRPMADGSVKIGKPYKIAGRTYVPRDDRDYDKVGFASWYGPGHHGLQTANGERFDMDAITAAHPTLPLPSYVQVTAMETGRTVLVRINDRGPFIGDRIIDLSRGSARALGVEKAGVAKVRVRRVYPSEAERTALLRGRTVRPAAGSMPATDAAPQMAARSVSAASPTPVYPPVPVVADVAGSSPVPVVNRPVAASQPAIATVAIPPATVGQVPSSGAGARYIQVAALGDSDRADALASRLGGVGDAHVEAGGNLYRVRLGPYDGDAAARSALAELRRRGYQDAHIVTATP